MPNFPIVDTHVHLTDLDQVPYSWVNSVPALNRSFSMEDFRQACGRVDVDEIVFVEVDADDASKELQWVSQLARQEPRIKGIVAKLPLERGNEVRPQLESLADNQLVKGVRRLLQSEEVDFCLQPSFLEGVQLLHAYDLSFDICIYHQHLANAIEMVKRCSDVRFVLDHMGKPDIKSQKFDPWKSQIQTLAELPNVTCKISGMVTEADHQHWQPRDLRPYIDHVIRCFGFDRVMYGGDWFVSTLACDYPQWVQALDDAVGDASHSELRKLYRETARSVYRLSEEG